MMAFQNLSGGLRSGIRLGDKLIRPLVKRSPKRVQALLRWMRHLNSYPPDVVGPVPRPAWLPRGNLREALARTFIRGSGLEIGALYAPLFVPPGVKVHYVDRFNLSDLHVHLSRNPETNKHPLVNVDIVDDGEKLAKIPNDSQDFVISNHFLEHTEDPIGTIRRHLEVVRTGGIVYLGVPDMRFTFDVNRPRTTLEHLYRDHFEGAKWSYESHLREWVELVEGKTGDAAALRHRELLEQNHPSIHYHVWDHDSLGEMFGDLRRRLGLPYAIEGLVSNRDLIETVAILRKT